MGVLMATHANLYPSKDSSASRTALNRQIRRVEASLALAVVTLAKHTTREYLEAWKRLLQAWKATHLE